MDRITAAVAAARYNEAVIVEVDNGMNTTTSPSDNRKDEMEPDRKRELVLVATLDEDNGGVIWQDANSAFTASASPTEATRDIGVQRHLRTKRWVLPMLNDHVRNTMYQEAIEKACRYQKSRLNDRLDLESLRVLDIGSGTGLLAMVASRCLSNESNKRHDNTEGSKSRIPRKPPPKATRQRHQSDEARFPRVSSMEMAPAMARLATSIVAANDLDHDIRIICQHSAEAQPYSGNAKADICTSELLESGLLGEGIIPAMRDAWERLLNDDASVVPQRARVVVQLWETCGFASRLACVDDYPLQDDKSILRFRTSASQSSQIDCGGDGSILPLHAEKLPGRALSDAMQVLHLDFTRKEKIPRPSGGSHCVRISPTASGTVHGILFWWELDLWNNITYSTKAIPSSSSSPAPTDSIQAWQDHWEQCFFILPCASRMEVKKRQPVELVCRHSDTRLSFSLAEPTDVDDEDDDHTVVGTDVGALHSESYTQPAMKKQRKEKLPAFSPYRIAQLNDPDRMRVLEMGTRFALQQKGVDVPVLDVSDFAVCAMLVALCGGTNVRSLESSAGKLPLTAACMAQLGNGLPEAGSTFEILQGRMEGLSLSDIGSEAIQLVVAEPFYELLEGWHVQEALNLYHLVRAGRRTGLVAAENLAVPSRASICACAVECRGIFEAYHSCGDTVCGFDHTAVHPYSCGMYRGGGLFLPVVGQYEYNRLSETVELCRLDYTGCPSKSPASETNRTNAAATAGDAAIADDGSVPIPLNATKGGTCHGILYWVEYGVLTGTDQIEVVSTHNEWHRQGLCLLDKPLSIGPLVSSEKQKILRCRFLHGGLPDLNDHKITVELEGSED